VNLDPALMLTCKRRVRLTKDPMRQPRQYPELLVARLPPGMTKRFQQVLDGDESMSGAARELIIAEVLEREMRKPKSKKDRVK
jgi:hypothetical protein